MIQWQVERVITIYFFTLNHNYIDSFYLCSKICIQWFIEKQTNKKYLGTDKNIDILRRSDYNLLILERTRINRNVRKISWYHFWKSPPSLISFWLLTASRRYGLWLISFSIVHCLILSRICSRCVHIVGRFYDCGSIIHRIKRYLVNSVWHTRTF